MNAWSGGICFLVLLAPCAIAANSGDRPLTVREELTRLLIEDAKRSSQNAKAAAAAHSKAPKGTEARPSAPTAPEVEPGPTDLWIQFTDTGIITASHGKDVTRELTFGPCTDGELLNQRFLW